MKSPIRKIAMLSTVTLISGLMLLSSPIFAQAALGGAQISKLAKQFGVSPDVLSKFGGMSVKDMQSGLGIAKQVSAKGGMSMDAAASEVLNASKGGNSWNSIASDFGVDDASKNSSATDSLEGEEKGMEMPSKPGKSKKKLRK